MTNLNFPEVKDRDPNAEVDMEILNDTIEYIRPAVQADGGDIKLASVENGVVNIEMLGACQGCPMSIATLKRKTQTKYNNMSVNTGTGFSLNGTTRNQGYIGQTSLSRTLVRTLRNGTAVRGHGGCCTDASKAPILQAEFTNLEDNSVVKKSSLNTMGMLKRRYNNKNYNFVKPDSNNNVNSSSTVRTWSELTFS